MTSPNLSDQPALPGLLQRTLGVICSLHRSGISNRGLLDALDNRAHGGVDARAAV